MTSPLLDRLLRLGLPAVAGLLGQALAPEPDHPRAPFLPPLGATPAPFFFPASDGPAAMPRARADDDLTAAVRRLARGALGVRRPLRATSAASVTDDDPLAPFRRKSVP